MQLSDYLIDQGGKDWVELLRPWCPPLAASFTVWLVNRFGDVFAVYEDGSVHMLDVGRGTVTRFADDREDFATKIDEEDNADDWLLVSLVDQCVAAGLTLKQDQCYSYTIPPIFKQSKYEVENVYPLSLAEHYSVLADMHRQIKDLPDGSRVKVVVTNAPEKQRKKGT